MQRAFCTSLPRLLLLLMLVETPGLVRIVAQEPVTQPSVTVRPEVRNLPETSPLPSETAQSPVDADTLVRLKSTEWVPEVIDNDPLLEYEKEVGAQMEARPQTIEIVSEKERSEFAAVVIETNQHLLELLTNTDNIRFSYTEALELWEKTPKKTIKESAKWIDRRLNDYKDALEEALALPPPVLEDESRLFQEISRIPSKRRYANSLATNSAAQKQIENVLKILIQGGEFYSPQARSLVKVHEALRSEARSIRTMGHVVRAIVEDAKISSKEPSTSDSTMSVDFPDGKSVEPTDLFSSVTVRAPKQEPHYGERRRRTRAELEDMLRSTDVSVAIRRTSDHELVGSGVVIGRNLLLTCGHVLGGRGSEIDVKRYEVLSEEGVGSQYIYPLGRRVAAGEIWHLTGNHLDYALFEVERSQQDNAAISDRIASRKICLATLKRDDAIYVSGYAWSEKERDHPEGKVLYPFQIQRFLSMMPAFIGEASGEGESKQSYEQLLEQYEHAYKQCGTVYCLVRPVGSPGIQPVYGVECNTERGHSGSPVFSSERRELIGLLIGGTRDGPTREKATWRDMEFVLPLAPILEQLNNDPKLAGWKERYGVVIADDPMQLTSTSNIKPRN